MIIPVSESLYAKKFSSLLVLTTKFSRHESISQSLYRQRRKEYAALPKDRMETHACLENLVVKTSKDENFLRLTIPSSKSRFIVIGTNFKF
jgi:hypothetical protein